MTNLKKTITIIFLYIIICLLLTSCSFWPFNINRNDEEIVDAGEFTGIPNSYLISKIKVPGQAIDVNISGNYAYLTNDLGVLYVIDIGEKENPRLVGNYNTGESNKKSVYGMFIEGDFAYIDTTSENEDWEISRLEIVDISRKSDPEIVGGYELDGLPSGIWVKNDFAYININFYDYEKKEYMDESRLIVLDIKDKNNPKIVSSCKVPSNSWSIYVLGSYAYISSCKLDEENEKYIESIFQIVDIGDLSDLKILGNCKIPGGAWEMDSVDGFIYVSSLSGGIYAINVKNKNSPVIVDILNTNGTSYDVIIN